MQKGNWSRVTEFILMGFPHKSEMRYPLFLLFLTIYFFTLLGNFLILVAIRTDSRLHVPMYFFLGNLSFLDIWFSTVTLPKMLEGLLTPCGVVISFKGCVAQVYFSQLLGCTECFLYTIMSYDRYLAISSPLRYSSIMHRSMYIQLTAGVWLGCSVHSTIQTSLAFRLPYCGVKEIDNFFCDPPALLELACADTIINERVIFFGIGMVVVVCLVLILFSYGSILRIVLSLGKMGGRRRTISTFASHFVAVACFYVPCVFTYLRPNAKGTLDRAVAVFYTILTPMLNPLIYTLRNKEVKASLAKLKGKGLFLLGK
uniref:G-protein coupled receptors family 1 profile domain-containing protein n=1 Tax=Sphenodon punctatus TaxID=8508 RepID=A0A8D0GRU4_SPHPU